VQVHAALHDDEAKAGAGDFPDVGAAVKGLEKARAFSGGNADALVLHGEHGVPALAATGDVHRGAGRAVFDGVGEEVREDVAEQRFVAVGSGEAVVHSPPNGATAVSGGLRILFLRRLVRVH
jgi:hypothetical protein